MQILHLDEVFYACKKVRTGKKAGNSSYHGNKILTSIQLREVIIGSQERSMIIMNYKCYFLIHYKISQHIRLQPSNYKGSVTSQESSRIKAIERIKRRAGSRAAMASVSIAARSNIVIFLKGVLVIL
jgi:hypothetical protein